ncbi:MAG: FAD:protein FMN transferase [Methylococcales bacterium]|nr:FAD:protein FMN transferase [Methylococcales bacterium]
MKVYSNNKPFLLGLFVFFLISCTESQNQATRYPFLYSDGIMGTSFTIKATDVPTAVNKDNLKKQIKQRLDQLNGQLSTYEPQSALSLFNKSVQTNWQHIPESLLTVLKEAQKISQLTKGAFDVTVGKLVNLWGFGVEPMRFTAPNKQKLKEVLSTTGYQHLLIHAKTAQIKKAIPTLYLDLSAIAKGYAVDEVALLLEKAGIQDYMVEIGGEIRLKGQNIHGEGWKIALEKPIVEKRIIEKVISLTDISMATSGDYRNYFEADGVRYSHSIDPRTGDSITHQLASVTILHSSTMTADALATAMMVLGENKGYQLAQQHQIAALFIIKTADGFKEKSTDAFTHFFKEKL